MIMKLMTARGASDLGTWLGQPEREAAQRLRESQNAPTVSKPQVRAPVASLQTLQAEMRQNARRESWIVGVLWAVSWGAVALLFV
jgi:hypothetical protein